MFEVRLTKKPLKYIKRIPEKVRQTLIICFEKLEETPFLVAEPLHGPLKGKWKITVGDLMVIVSIDIDRKVIKVFYIGHRGDAYK
ncbi:MAG: type II toxin-antitoxin system RelE/ParE family toxin [bacterium]